MESPAPHQPLAKGSLSRRLLWLTFGAVLLMQVLSFLPAVSRARSDWLQDRLTYGQLAAMALGDQVPAVTPRDLLRLAGVEFVRLLQPGSKPRLLGEFGALESTRPIDLSHESWVAGLRATVANLLDGRDRLVLLQAVGQVPPGTLVFVVFHSSTLTAHLRAAARKIAGFGLLVAGLLGVSIYLLLRMVLVLPIRRLTDSIAAFRADPERMPPLELDSLAPLRVDEVAVAGQELAEMQRELRAALWRYARLAALGTAVAKVSHDLRGMLAPALLSAERLQNNADPNVRRIGETVVRAVERATELVRGGLEFAREGPMTLTRRPFALHEAIVDATEQVTAVMPSLSVENRVRPELEIDADREQVCRVLTNLLRNAGEAAANRVSVDAAVRSGRVEIVIGDNGSGLPAQVEAALFKPFVTGGRRGSTGLGLAIARDLMRAHLGDIELISTGPDGTSFRLTLPMAVALRPPLRAAAAG